MSTPLDERWQLGEFMKIATPIADEQAAAFLAAARHYVAHGDDPWWMKLAVLAAQVGSELMIAVGDPTLPLLYEESLEELLRDGETYDAVIPGFAYRGLKTLVVALSKAGKTYTTMSFIAPAVLSGGQRVKFLSEEPRATFVDKLRMFNLMDELGNGFRLSRKQHPEINDLTWAEVVERLAEEVRREHIDLVVVDTLRPWLGLNADESNKAEVMGAAIDALSPVCAAGAAVIVLHQAPWDSLRARGSTEVHAASDLIFGITGEGYGPREIRYIGGRVEGIDEKRNVRWAGDHSEDLGRMRSDQAQHVGDLLNVLDETEESLTVEDLADRTDYSEKSIRRWLTGLEKRGLVVREAGDLLDGRGRTADRWRRPGRFTWLLAEEEELSTSPNLSTSEELGTPHDLPDMDKSPD